MTTTKRQRSVYFPATMLADIDAEAERQDRSVSWLLQQAWRIAQAKIAELPTVSRAAKWARGHYR